MKNYVKPAVGAILVRSCLAEDFGSEKQKKPFFFTKNGFF